MDTFIVWTIDKQELILSAETPVRAIQQAVEQTDTVASQWYWARLSEFSPRIQAKLLAAH